MGGRTDFRINPAIDLAGASVAFANTGHAELAGFLAPDAAQQLHAMLADPTMPWSLTRAEADG